MIVVDANIVSYHLLQAEPFAEEIRKVADVDPDWIGPLLLRSELLNVLTMYHRERGLSIEEAVRLGEQGERLLENSWMEVPIDRILSVVTESDLSAYDAQYVALARDVDRPLLTYDRPVLSAFPEIALTPKQFLQ